jgi:uncharacterized protein (TIGR02118 family)
MLRLMGLWTAPADVEAFEREYLGVHVPKLQRLPACRDVRTARCLDGPFFRVTEVLFDNLDDIHGALRAEAGRGIQSEAESLAGKFGVHLDVLVVAEAT